MTMRVEGVFYDIGKTVDLGTDVLGIIGSVLSLDTGMGAILNLQNTVDLSENIEPEVINAGETVTFNNKTIQGT